MHLTSSMRTLFIFCGICIVQISAHVKSPRLTFSKEPPSQVEFVNTRGARIECAATGHPTPNISWILIDGTPVNDIPGLRETSSSGSLIFQSFRPENFRPDVHSSVYRCVASNGAGIIHSRNARVRGVVLQKFDIQVYDVYAMKGSTAVFKCHVPSVLEEYVVVTSWIKNDNTLIQSSTDLVSNDKYAIMLSGELHIRDVSLEDNGSQYKCKATHRLTGDVLISSSAGQIFVTEHHGSFAPRIVHSSSSIIRSVGQIITLPCAFQGYPVPSFRWHKKTSSGQMVSVNNNSRIVITTSALIIKDCQISDGGNYVCEISNEVGKEFVDVSVTIQDPLSAEIQPLIQEVQSGATASFKCIVTGQPIASISWLHNGTPITNAVDDILTVNDVQLMDQGMYQCIAKNSFETVQAAAEIQMTEVAPQFVDTFKEVIVQPQSSVILKCSSNGIPTPDISWEMNGVKINSSSHMELSSETPKDGSVESTIIISKIAVEDGGLYSCTATNRGGKSHHSARVNVYGTLGAHSVPDLQLISGSSATLNCPLYGFPIPEISWEKNGMKMPIDLNHELLANGNLFLKNIDRRVNSGSYKCIADMVEANINVKVLVPPKIVPFEFQDDLLREGMRARLQCVISEGDLPLTVKWLKDDNPIPSNLGVLVRELDEFSSILTITTITPSHNGKYTCVASNPAATVSHTAELSVNVKPKIVPFQFGGLHTEGSPARVVCGLQEGDAPIHFSWLHNGVPVIAGNSVSIHEVDGLSSILSFSSLSSIHSGTFTCVAENGAGVANHNATLHVNVPPKIVPFTFQDEHIVEGSLARVSCIVSRGDLPLNLHWERNGIKIEPGLMGIEIKSFDEHSAILSIAEVSSEHNGLYTCIAKNDAGSARHSAQLLVKVPPRWVLQPTDVSVLRSSDAILHCQADGFPKPKISWMYVKDVRQKGNTQTINNDRSHQKYENGSLLIKNIDSENEGYYFCNANNGIGIGIYTKVEIKIHAPPHFRISSYQSNVIVGQTIEIKCIIYGDRPIVVSWYRNDNLILESSPRFKIETSTESSEITSVLIIKRIEREDHGTFQCVAENNYGKNKTEFSLTVKDKPEPPTSLEVTSLGSQFVELSWKMDYSGNVPINKYVIQYKEAPGIKFMISDSWDDAVTMETVNGDPTNSIVANLHPATHYLFRLFAENELGRSKPSQVLRVSTNEDVPSGYPENVQVESINTETFKVMWKSPDEKTWNGKIQGFYIGYKEVDTDDPYLYKTLLTPNPKVEELSVQIGGLKKFTKYAVVVQAYNGQGKGPLSEPVIVMTSEGAPSLPPTDVRCTTLTSQSIHVTWIAPPADSINGILRGYKVIYKPTSDWLGGIYEACVACHFWTYNNPYSQNSRIFLEDLAENYNITLPTSLTLNQLEKFRNYSIEVLAMTKAGDGPRSNTAFCKTLDDEPGPPVDIKAIATSDDSVIVAWKPPDHPNGVIRSYSVYWKTSVGNVKETGSRTVPERDQNYEVTNLKKGRRYEFWITASTAAGEGSPSRVISQTPNGPTVPAKVVSFEDKIIMPWKSDIDLFCLSVGIPEPTRKWIFKDRIIESSTKTKLSSDGTLSLGNIQEDDAGDYSCQVQNDFGSDKITYTIIVLAPPSAPVVEITKVSSTSIELQWKTPSSKMSRIKGYNLHVKKDGGDWKEITIGADVRSYRLSSLECGTRYEIYMSAFNKIGIGAPSDVLLVPTNGTVPTPPNKSDLIEETSNSVSLYLNTWKSNSCPILYYVVEYSPKSSQEWIFVSNSIKPEHRRLVIPNLKAATWYALRMTAHNSAGSSVAKYDFATLTTTGATIPPDLLSDSAHEQIDGLWTYLNFYIIVPICCTVIILLAILGIACYYVRSKNGAVKAQRGQRMSTLTPQIKRGDSSESFAYMQRGTMSKSSGSSKHAPSDITPYATLQLTGQRSSNIHGQCPDKAPPLPPPRMGAFPHSGQPSRNPHFQGEQSGFIPRGTAETTFIFPNPPNDGRLHHYPAQYPQEAFKHF